MKSGKSYRSYKSVQWLKTRAYKSSRDDVTTAVDEGLVDWYLPDPEELDDALHQYQYNGLADMEDWIALYDGRNRSGRHDCPCCWDSFYFGFYGLNGKIEFEIATLLILDKANLQEDLLDQYRQEIDRVPSCLLEAQPCAISSVTFSEALSDADKEVIKWFNALGQHSPEFYLNELANAPAELNAFANLRNRVDRSAWFSPGDGNRSGSDYYFDVERVAQFALLTSPVWRNKLSDWQGGTAVDLLTFLLPSDLGGSALYEIVMSPAYRSFKQKNETGEATQPQHWTTMDSLDPLLMLVALAQGASIHRIAHHYGLTLSKKFIHILLSLEPVREGNEDPSFRELLQRCVVRSLGGSDQEWRRAELINHLLPDNEFWQSALAWLVRWQDQLNDEQAHAIMNWGYHRYTEDDHFSFRKRALNSAFAQAIAYQQEILRRLEAEHNGTLTWPEQGWGCQWQDEFGTEWTLAELTTQMALAKEGVAQSHCVGRYAARCANGESVIAQLRRNGARDITIEVSLRHHRIVQARGRFNKFPSGDANAAIAFWANRFGLRYQY